MPKRMIQNLEELKKMVRQEVGVSDWHQVTQEAINLFADATLDPQWIHIDRAGQAGIPLWRPHRPRVLHAEPSS